MPTVGSLFSGAGGFDLGFEAAGFDVAWQVEIDKDCVSVLERHWPTTPRWRDVAEVDPADLAPVNVVIFGSPCQDFSVAGKRAGLEGERSGLFGEAIRIIRGLRPAPAFCVWENVPGALSSARGRDFGAVLDALADIGALDIAWRVLDARHFGVPQRRRRIFLVADFGAERAGQVLFESASGSRDSAPCGEAGERLAGDVEDGAGGSGEPVIYQEAQYGVQGYDAAGSLRAGRIPEHQMLIEGGAGVVGWKESQSGVREADVVGVLDANYGSRRHNGVMTPALSVPLNAGAHPGSYNGQDAYNDLLLPVAAFGGNRTAGPIEVATACNAHGGPHGRQDFESETFIVANVASSITQSAGHHGWSGGRGDGADNKVVSAVAFDWQKGGGGNDHSWRGKSREWIERAGDYAGSLSATKHDAVAISENQRSEVLETPYAHQLSSAGGKPGQGYQAVREGMAVRRLTPLECERLQGWPSDHTRWRANGDEISDGPRYRMVGNGVAAPVATWIGRRLCAALEAS